MKRSGASIIVETLIEQGVDTIFGYPGGAVLHLFDELYKSADRLHTVVTCHEQGASHAADGYARSTGKTGVVVSTSGPGATNLVTGIATAYLDSTPLVAITGNVARDLLGRDSFQEVDILGITMPVTKHNYLVRNVESLADIVREAFFIANSGRPGPVLIDVPKDIQAAFCEFENKEKRGICKDRPNGRAEFEKATELLRTAERPFIYAGGGVVISDASEELVRFAEAIDAPIGASMMALSAFDPAKNERFLGMTGMHGTYITNKLMAEADLIIAVGTRFSDRATGNKMGFADGKRFIHIDIDPAEIGKNIPAYVALIGDVKTNLVKFLSEWTPVERPAWRAHVRQERENKDVALQMDDDRLTPQAVIEEVRKYAAADTNVATDVGQHQMWTAQYYAFSKPRTFLTSGGLGTMGFGLGAAIGAAVGTGKRTVLFTGDGSFHMNMNELATVVTNRLPVTVIIFNNRTLGMVRQWQKLFFGGRYAGTTPDRETDYVKLAEAFGLPGERVSCRGELTGAIRRSLAGNRPYLIEAAIDQDEKVLPMIPPGGTIQDIILKG